MPSYFYHLAIELFARPQPNTLSGASSYAVDGQSNTSLAFDSACEALLPFQKRPRSSTPSSSRGSRHLSSEKHRCSSSSLSSSSFPSAHSAHSRSIDTPTPPLSSPHPLYTTSSTTASELEHDLRLDKVSIECIDMIRSGQETPASKRTGRRELGGDTHDKNDKNPIATGIGTDILGGLRTKGQYVPLDKQTSESVWGIVHLYRDTQETPYLVEDEYPLELKGSAAAAARQSDDSGGYGHGHGHGQDGDGGRVLSHADEECTTLCVLAVPSYMSPSDFLGFVGEVTLDDVSHFRMIRTARANRYMVLMKFRSGKKAMAWQREWNGKVFNSMEPETCHVVFVKTVEIQAVDPESPTSHPPTSPQRTTSSSTIPQSSSIPSATLSLRPLAPPTPALIELPTCPVCLERMDETTGLLTIICQHVFHCTCLQKWKGSGCPVCRYTQDDFRKVSSGSQGGPFESDDPAECSVCHSDLNLWVCLICGNVGCGRYDGAHAFAHYKDTAHAFAMDLATQRVWDYVGDAYVHRIIQSKTDGKLVELPAADHSALDPPDWTDAVPREKLENMSVEYMHLLTSQLESQRVYFEGVVERAVDKASRASAAAALEQQAAEKATASLRDSLAQGDKLTNETVPGLERDKARAEKRAEKFEAMARKMEKEWREEKTMNESLMQRIEHLSAEVETLKAANADLMEQNRDLTFFISGSERLKEMDMGEEVVEGTVGVPEPEKKKKGKGRKK